MSNTNNNEPRKPLRLSVTEPQKFEKLAATTMETTQRLAKRINHLFETAFVDFYGCAVYCTAGNGNVAPYQQFAVELHFKPLTLGSINPGDSRKRAFKPVEEGTAKSDVIAGLKNIYGTIRSSSRFQLTEDAAEILSEFMLPGTNVDPFKPSSYDQYKAEYTDMPQYGNSPIMVRIAGLDLVKLIKKVYGTRNAEGKRVDYGIIPYGPVVPNMNNTMMQNNANWRVVIMQIEAEKTFDLASEFGLIPVGNGAGGAVITGTL